MNNHNNSVKPDHLIKGEFGENAAAEYLHSIGWRILERNYRAKHCEIDIIAYDGNEIVFIEVRTRSKGWMMQGADSVGPQKLSKLIYAARVWIANKRFDGFWRIDLISITLENNKIDKIEHLRDITEPIQ